MSYCSGQQTQMQNTTTGIAILPAAQNTALQFCYVVMLVRIVVVVIDMVVEVTVLV